MFDMALHFKFLYNPNTFPNCVFIVLFFSWDVQWDVTNGSRLIDLITLMAPVHFYLHLWSSRCILKGKVFHFHFMFVEFFGDATITHAK
jgi:hypothetical protein